MKTRELTSMRKINLSLRFPHISALVINDLWATQRISVTCAENFSAGANSDCRRCTVCEPRTGLRNTFLAHFWVKEICGETSESVPISCPHFAKGDPL
jgi:hypothetical protein